MTKIRLAIIVAGAVAAGSYPVVAQDTAVRVGIFPAAGPFTFYDAGSNAASGATAEIVQLIIEGAGREIEWVPIEGSGSNPAVEAIGADRIDVISYPFQMTESRKAQFEFTDPIFRYGETIVVHRDDTREYRSADDLEGLSVGVVEGSSYVDLANSVGADTRVGDDLDAVIAQVGAGETDAAMGTAPVFIYRASTMPNLRVPEDYTSEDELPAGLGVKTGNGELLAVLNDGLQKLATQGTIQKIATHWGVADLVAE